MTHDYLRGLPPKQNCKGEEVHLKKTKLQGGGSSFKKNKTKHHSANTLEKIS